MRASSKFFILLALAFCCCSKKAESNDDELQFRYYNLEKMGWKSKAYTQKVGDLSFTATEVPIQYYLLKQIGRTKLGEVDSLYEQNKYERIMEISISQEDEKNLLDKKFTGMDDADAIKYLSFGIDKDFRIVTSKGDTIKCNGVNYERNFKVAPYQKLMLFFSGIPPKDDIQLLYEDHLFKKGTLKFKFANNTEILL